MEGEMIHAQWCSMDLTNVRHRIVEDSDSAPGNLNRCDSIRNHRKDRQA